MTQTQMVLQRLMASPNEWVRMTELGRFAGCWAVHSRIADCRRAGNRIENHKTKVDGKTHSYYRLLVTEDELDNWNDQQTESCYAQTPQN